jgi:hypothetical protein
MVSKAAAGGRVEPWALKFSSYIQYKIHPEPPAISFSGEGKNLFYNL